MRTKLVGLCFLALTALSPTQAVSTPLPAGARVLVEEAVGAAFEAASACYSLQELMFSSLEARGRGASKAEVLAAAASRTPMRPELNAAINLAFEVERVTEPKVGAFFAGCLDKTRAQILDAIPR